MRRSQAGIAVTVIALLFGTGCSATGAGGAAPPNADTEAIAGLQATVCEPVPGEQTTPIGTAKLIIEYNATDDDLGVHGAFDDHGWSEVCVIDPNGRPVLVTSPQNQLKTLTMAGIFFESREPPTSEFSMTDLKTAFPAGAYQVRAKSFDGKILVGQARFTHLVPAPPKITSPELSEEPQQAPAVARNRVEIEWTPVTESLDGNPITITGYEIIVTKIEHDDPDGFSRPTYDVHLRPGVDELTVPLEFLEPATVYELEVLALEDSGNQTISVGFFRTR